MLFFIFVKKKKEDLQVYDFFNLEIRLDRAIPGNLAARVLLPAVFCRASRTRFLLISVRLTPSPVTLSREVEKEAGAIILCRNQKWLAMIYLSFSMRTIRSTTFFSSRTLPSQL